MVKLVNKVLDILDQEAFDEEQIKIGFLNGTICAMANQMVAKQKNL